jgi:hypothetical protein
MKLLQIPFLSEIEKADNILLAGAGGGFDIFCGLPLYFALRKAGKKVYLANLSFSNIYGSTGVKLLDPVLVEVTSQTQGRLDYFPEVYLARWFKEFQGEDVPIYCLARVGVQPLIKAYQKLIDYLSLDAIILIDGGTDSLMKGDEADLGSPDEDIASIAAVSQLNVPYKALVCLGFGIEKISHAQVLEAISEITQAGGFLGAWTLTKNMSEVELYREATEYVFKAMPQFPSIISSSVFSALDGHFGDYHSNHRTHGSNNFINALMTIYWCFDLDIVAKRILYLDKVMKTQNFRDMTVIISEFRESIEDQIKSWSDIPI